MSDVPNVRLFFTREQRDHASDVMRQSFSGYGGAAQGYAFDSVEYTRDHRLARLTRDGQVFHIPARNILMIVGDESE